MIVFTLKITDTVLVVLIKLMVLIKCFLVFCNFSFPYSLSSCLSIRQQLSVAVLMEIWRVVPGLRMTCVIMDFETAMWAAVREVHPGVPIQGCVFDWIHTVYHKVVDSGIPDNGN